MILTVGIARFAYTPLLPLMREQPGLSDAMGGFALLDDERDWEIVRRATLRRSFTAVARQAALDPDDGMAL